MPVSKDHSFSSSHRIKTSSSSFLPIHDILQSKIVKMRFAALLAVATLAVVTTAVPVTEGTCGEFCRDPTGKTGDDLVIAKYVSGETIAGYCHCRVSISIVILHKTLSLTLLLQFTAGSCKDLCAELDGDHNYPDLGYCRPNDALDICHCFVPLNTPGSTTGPDPCADGQGKGSFKPQNIHKCPRSGAPETGSGNGSGGSGSGSGGSGSGSGGSGS